jgi:hypothetical protein
MGLMTREEKLKMLEEWKSAHDNLKLRFVKLGRLFDSVTGPLFDAAWMTFSNYTKLVSILLGDEFETLEWYWMENDFGRKSMEAGTKGRMRKITDFEQLLWLIEVCE